MFIGHFGAAEAILAIDKSLPVLPVAIGVAYPDLLWPFLVYFGKEKVKPGKTSPLQRDIHFTSYPFSHSLVLSGILTLVPAIIIGMLYHSLVVAIAFFVAALSHWLLDIPMHLKDLPIKGFGHDHKVGLGFWKHGAFAFVFEYGFFVLCTLLFTAREVWLPLLTGGFIFHALNANSFFGFTKFNLTKRPAVYATVCLVGFSLAILWFTELLR